MKTVKKSMVKTMNQSISRFLGRLAKSFGGEEDQEVSLRKSELKEIEQGDDQTNSDSNYDFAPSTFFPLCNQSSI